MWIMFRSQLISTKVLKIFTICALWQWDNVYAELFRPFVVRFVSTYCFPKNILYSINKRPTCVTSEDEEYVWAGMLFLVELNKERKLAAWSTSIPQGRRLTFDKIVPSENTLLSTLAKADADLIKSWFWNSNFGYLACSSWHFPHGLQWILLEKTASNVYWSVCAWECLALCEGQGEVFASCHAQIHFKVLLCFRGNRKMRNSDGGHISNLQGKFCCSMYDYYVIKYSILFTYASVAGIKVLGAAFALPFPDFCILNHTTLVLFEAMWTQNWTVTSFKMLAAWPLKAMKL